MQDVCVKVGKVAGPSDTPEQIRDKLISLDSGEKLPITAIDGAFISADSPVMVLNGLVIHRDPPNQNNRNFQVGDILMMGKLNDGSFASYGRYRSLGTDPKNPSSWDDLITIYNPE